MLEQARGHPAVHAVPRTPGGDLRTLIAPLLAALLVLPGCATRTAGTSVVRLSPGAFDDASTGVVVFSAGAPQGRAGFVTYLLVYPQGSIETIRHSPLIPIDLFAEKSDFEDHHGMVHALNLAPGSYYFSTMSMSARTRVRPTFVFDVRAGETTYLGELFMSTGTGGRSFQIRDQYDRDLAIAREKSPALQGRTVARGLLRPGPVQTFR